ncbi:glycosyltransferase family 2 protein [Sphingomonas sp. DBB INV C78]|uniref:glycosyltransferase family 2 protein n=1 Tax=Sphingomonas sp. DBB INV C78 TaxID=3349434 RepID=UPI0036D3C2F5
MVIPCFNEEENVRAIHAEVKAVAERHATSYEIIFIDNQSQDRTRDLLREICAADPHTRAIFNNRNYGQMRSPTHGIYQARGDAVIGMCADFQDPPAMIGEFLRLWRAGAQVVLAQRRSEKTGPLLHLIRRGGYSFLGRFADYPVVPGATGFGLFDRAVVEELARWNEPEPFFRGMVVEAGFRLAIVPFDRPQRAAGETKNDLGTLVDFAISGIAGSSKSLLRWPIKGSVYAGVLAVLLLCTGLGAALLGASAWPFLSFGVPMAMFAMLMLFVGLIGEQVRMISERTRNVPLVIEEERLNFVGERAAADVRP